MGMVQTAVGRGAKDKGVPMSADQGVEHTGPLTILKLAHIIKMDKIEVRNLEIHF